MDWNPSPNGFKEDLLLMAIRHVFNPEEAIIPVVQEVAWVVLNIEDHRLISVDICLAGFALFVRFCVQL